MYVVLTGAAAAINLAYKMIRRKKIKKTSAVVSEELVREEVLKRFYEEYEIVLANMDGDRQRDFEESVSLLETFITFCDEPQEVGIRHLMMSVMTARNCWYGLSEGFDPEAVPHILSESKGILHDMIEKSRCTKRQRRYAFDAAEDLIEALGIGMSLDSESSPTDCDSELEEITA